MNVAAEPRAEVATPPVVGGVDLAGHLRAACAAAVQVGDLETAGKLLDLLRNVPQSSS